MKVFGAKTERERGAEEELDEGFSRSGRHGRRGKQRRGGRGGKIRSKADMTFVVRAFMCDATCIPNLRQPRYRGKQS